jgi:anaphase-promoting complex subunit 8
MLVAEWHEKRDEHDAALKHYKEVLRREPDMGAAWLSLARAQMKFANYDEAERAARKALSLHVPPEEVWRTLGNVHQYRQEFKAAIRAYRRAAKAAPDDWRVYLDLAVTYDTLSDPENTKQALKTVLQLNPNCEIARRRLRQLGGY